MPNNQGVTPPGPGSRASHGADKSSPPKASIPNADFNPLQFCGALLHGMTKRQCWCPFCQETYDPFFDDPATPEEQRAVEYVLERSRAFGRGAKAVSAGVVLGIRAAQAIEARRAIDSEAGVVEDESAVTK